MGQVSISSVRISSISWKWFPRGCFPRISNSSSATFVQVFVTHSWSTVTPLRSGTSSICNVQSCFQKHFNNTSKCFKLLWLTNLLINVDPSGKMTLRSYCNQSCVKLQMDKSSETKSSKILQVKNENVDTCLSVSV